MVSITAGARFGSVVAARRVDAERAIRKSGEQRVARPTRLVGDLRVHRARFLSQACCREDIADAETETRPVSILDRVDLRQGIVAESNGLLVVPKKRRDVRHV
jgi:hypothetical protein